MSYSETLETRGNFRVRLILDEYADEPYDDGQSPLVRISGRYDGTRAEHIMLGTRPQNADSYAEAAIERWGSPSSDTWPLVEKYLRAYFGTRQIETWYSGDYWYVTYDTARWREYVGKPEYDGEPGNLIDMSEYRAYVEGDVWGYVVEKRVTWHADDDYLDDRDTWEHVDSCYGFYGRYGANGEYLEQTAREALEYAVSPDKPAEDIPSPA